MPTINQLIKNKRFSKKINLKKTPALYSNPQKQGTCISVFVKTPRKPNSALRKVAKVRLVNSRIITVYIPGEGHNISKFSDVLISGRRIRDLPGVKYGALRGKLDLSSLDYRKNSRSKYGSKKCKKKEIIFKPEKEKKKELDYDLKKLFCNKVFSRAYFLFLHGKSNVILVHWWIKCVCLFNMNFFDIFNKNFLKDFDLFDILPFDIFMEYLYKYLIKSLLKERYQFYNRRYKSRYKVLFTNQKKLYLIDTISNEIHFYNIRK